jgi:phosphate transport system permease protein
MSKSKSIQRRHFAEKRFRFFGRSMIVLVLFILLSIISGLTYKGYHAFIKAQILLTIDTEKPLDQKQVIQQVAKLLDVRGDDLHNVAQLVSMHAGVQLQKHKDRKGPIEIWLPLSDEVDQYLKKPNIDHKSITQKEMGWLQDLQAKSIITFKFNKWFFINSDSRSPERAGIWGAIIGSFYTILITLSIAFPLGTGTAIYLEEFAPRNSFVRFIELNISNLAAVPSIIFGLLGLAIFINFMGVPRSSALVAGMTLALMTLPTIIIASRSALVAVPSTIRQAAAGLGASSVQIVFHHVFPLALPGMMTGTLLGMARALGESAALLMIGMVAFIADTPETPTDSATVLPVQIFNWARNPEQGFVENTSAAILILLLFLGIMNSFAIIVRRKFEHKW